MSQRRRITEQLTGFAEKLIVKITLDTTANLQESTPVDTGWARANWVPGIGAPPPSNAENVQDPTSQQVAAKSREQGAATATVAATYRLPRGRVFVSNGVPYIINLNDGSSRQAPAGFVQLSIIKAITRDIRGFRG